MLLKPVSAECILCAEEIDAGINNDALLPNVSQSGEDNVISLQSLAHKENKKARKLADKGGHEYLRGHYAEALSCLQRAMDIVPPSAVLQNDLGVMYCALGKDREARKAFERAVQVDSSAAASYVNLSVLAFDTDKYSLS